MSKENSRLIINCGSSHISATVFTFNGSKLKVVKSDVVSLEYDFQNEDAWLPAVADGIREIVLKGKYSGKANFIIPGNQVLAKILMLPTVAKKANRLKYLHMKLNLIYPMI